MQWYNDFTTRKYKLEHDVEHPENMSVKELCDTITYIRQGWMSSPYAIELCRRAGNLERWASTHTRRKAVYEAAQSFGFRFL